MFQHYYYNQKFYVHRNYETNLKSIEVIEVFVLLEYKKNNSLWTLFIEPEQWKNIALETISEKNIQTLLSKGAKTVESTLLYDNYLDAVIQMAFVCAKNMIKPEDIFEISNKIINEVAYKDLLKVFYDDFPEKFI